MINMSITEKLTYSTVKISCKYADGSSGSGTGFIINLCENREKGIHVPLLITNNHVTDNSISTTFEFCKANEQGEPIDTEVHQFTITGNVWNKHLDNSVDLCSLPLAQILNVSREQNKPVFYIPLDKSIFPSKSEIESFQAMEDVVMVGYPIGLMDYFNHKPIIRRGITATHLKNNYQGKKEFLVDMACFPGSSGSPIFIVNEGSYHGQNGIILGSRIKFIGVLYAGPQYSASGILTFSTIPNLPHPTVSIPTNLGIAIKSERVLEFEPFYNNLLEANNNG